MYILQKKDVIKKADGGALPQKSDSFLRVAIFRMSRDNYRKSSCEVDADIAAKSRREDSSVAHKPFVTASQVSLRVCEDSG